MWVPRPRSYNCERCGNDFVSYKAMRYHFQAKHLGRIQCEICGKEVPQEKLLYHAKNDHEIIPARNSKNCCHMIQRKELKFVAMETSKSCRMCSKQFGTAHAREDHEKKHHHFTLNKRAQMSMALNPENILQYKTPMEIETFLKVKLQPISGSLRSACTAEVEGIIAFIKEVFPLPITYITKGGSYMKGTDAQDWSDVDIVLFSNTLRSLEDCQSKTPEILQELADILIASSWINRLILQNMTPFSLRFSLKCHEGHHSHSFDIMPCCDLFRSAVSAGLKESFYHKLYLCTDNDKTQLYMMTLLEYQVEFVKALPERVKDLMRLMKHWFKTTFAEPRKENKFRRLPSSYTVELITIHVWELAGKPLLFSFVQGMRAVLKLLVQYQNICVVWHKHYQPSSPVFRKVFMKQMKPFILDPVNPTFNVCENSNAWDEVAHVAKKSLCKPLFKDIQAKEPWLFTNHW